VLKALLARLHQGHRTIGFPAAAPTLPKGFQGRPELRMGLCAEDCRRCCDTCPTDAISRTPSGCTLDLGRCLFCGECAEACSSHAIRFGQEYRMAARTRSGLRLEGPEYQLAEAIDNESRRLFGRSLKFRQVSAGGCNACEADINVLSTVVFDLGRFGIEIVASPRHADGLIVTGPVPENMRLALLKTWEATPSPKLLIAVGSCAISGGPFRGHPEVHGGVTDLLPVDLFIPGCPPHPITILDGLLRLLGRQNTLPQPRKGPEKPITSTRITSTKSNGV